MTPNAATDVRRSAIVLTDAASDLPIPPGNAVTEMVVVEEICPPSAVYTPARIEQPIFYLTLRGSARSTVGTHRFTHRAGTLAVVANCVVREEVEAAQAWHVCYFLLKGMWAEQLVAYLAQRETSVLAFADADPRLRRLFTEVWETAQEQKSGWQWIVLSRLAELLAGLYAESASATPGNALLLRIAQLIDADPQARPTLLQLAAQVELTPRQLIHQFRLAAGEPLALWIRKRRVAASQILLGRGQSVAEVAEQLGFANPYHFSRTFKALTGMSPSTLSENVRRARLHLHGAPNSAISLHTGSD